MAIGFGSFRPASAIALVALIAIALPAASQSPPAYPTIHALGPQDLIFEQLADSIESFHRGEQGGGAQAELSFYAYAPSEDTDLFSLAAALSLPYDVLATLNRLPDAEAIIKGRTLLIPSQPGIFVAQTPESDLELLVKSLQPLGAPNVPIRAFVDGRRVDFLFYPGAEFNPNERIFFLVAGFRFPLPKGVITSGFGSRADPFTGKSIRFHTGIDIAAPYGTAVYAARSGKVESSGFSDVYGDYVIVVHDATWETLYGHLSKILAVKGQSVKTGDTIGLVGSTGMSTGPHLHFETRRRGVATDPAPLMMSR